MAMNLASKLFSTMRAVARPLDSVHSIAEGSLNQATAGGAWSLISVRTNVRNNFPKPRENKRIKVHGFEKRMSTRGGRLILMRRILRGVQVLSH